MARQFWQLRRREKPWPGEARPVDERLCLESRRHGIVLVRPLGWAVLLAIAGGFGATQRWPFDVVGAVAVALGALVAVRAVWRWDRTKIVVTTDRLSIVYGVLGRSRAAVQLDVVDAVELEQSLLGRLLGYGTLLAGSLEVAFVPAPREVCRLVERQIGV
jgi:membrane protein YdbS with pleckstrin-like domain